MTDQKSPENWEAEDHIKTLKRRLEMPRRPAAAGCEAHADEVEARQDMLRADVWIIRRLDVLLRTVRNGQNETEVDLRPGRIRVVGMSAKAIEKLAIYGGGGWIFGKLQGWW